MKTKLVVLSAICYCAIAVADATELITPDIFNRPGFKKSVEEGMFGNIVRLPGPVAIENRTGPAGASYCSRGRVIDRVLVREDVQLSWDKEGVYDIGRQLARKYGLTGIEYGKDAINLMDASQSFGMKPEDLAAHLQGALKGHEQAYFVAAAKYGIDPTILAAISILETGHGSSNAVRKFNNVGGMMDKNSPRMRGFLKFGSIDEGIDAMAKNLKEKYLDEGLDTIKKIGRKYAPVGRRVTNDPNHSNAKWPRDVTNIYNELGGKGFLETPDRLVSNQFHSGEM